MTNNINKCIDKYIKYIENDVLFYFNKNVIFVLFNKLYYMFYNENKNINANELCIKFNYDGICKHDNKIFYYVAFDENELSDIKRKLRDYNLLILDENFNTLYTHKKIKYSIYKEIYNDVLKNTKEISPKNNSNKSSNESLYSYYIKKSENEINKSYDELFIKKSESQEYDIF
jgi:hypothetical protein